MTFLIVNKWVFYLVKNQGNCSLGFIIERDGYLEKEMKTWKASFFSVLGSVFETTIWPSVVFHWYAAECIIMPSRFTSRSSLEQRNNPLKFHQMAIFGKPSRVVSKLWATTAHTENYLTKYIVLDFIQGAVNTLLSYFFFPHNIKDVSKGENKRCMECTDFVFLSGMINLELHSYIILQTVLVSIKNSNQWIVYHICHGGSL